MSDATPTRNGHHHQRRDHRLSVSWGVSFEKTRELEQKLPPALARVYERVLADPTDIGEQHKGTVRDLSINGAFIEAPALPLLSRVAMIVDVPGFRPVEAVGWVLWRRKESCLIDRPQGGPQTLGTGFGMLFEWISLDARLEIARRVALLA